MLNLTSKFNFRNNSLHKKKFVSLIILSLFLLLFYEIYPQITNVLPKNIFIKLFVLGAGAIIICSVAYWAMKTTHVFSQKVYFSNHKFSTIIFTIILILEILLTIAPKLSLFKARTDKVIEIIVAAIVIGFIEEFIFRGILFDAFIALFVNNKYVIFLASAFSSIIFGSAHAINLFHQNLSITLIQIAMASCLGLLLAYIHVVTNNLRWCILLHAWHDTSLQMVKPTSPNNLSLFVGIYVVIFLIMGWAMFSYNKKLNVYLEKEDKYLTLELGENNAR